MVFLIFDFSFQLSDSPPPHQISHPHHLPVTQSKIENPKSKIPSPAQPATGLGFIASALAQPVTPAEAALRPLSFADFTGQLKTVERLQVMVGAAKRRGDALNHILLSGPPGLGKTTLAFVIGNELACPSGRRPVRCSRSRATSPRC